MRRQTALLLPLLFAATSALTLAPLGAVAQTVPAVHVIATGGTISNLSTGRLTGEELVKGLPGIEQVANVTVEQFANVASGAITHDHWRRLAARVNELYRTRPELAGVVITHGTDTMEETAFFLDLTVAGCKPVIVTGAMRRANEIGADGPANLRDAIATAAAASAQKRGTLIVMNDDLFTARHATKAHPTRPDAFVAPIHGPIGSIDGPQPIFFGAPDRSSCESAAFDVDRMPAFPRVDILYSYIGADTVPIHALTTAGAKGLVIAGVGGGAPVTTQGSALSAARRAGVFVLNGTRTGGGPGLNPQKLRILLMLALATTTEEAKVRELLNRYAGR